MRFSRSITYRIISVFLVAVIFISTTGFSLHKHVCACKNEVVYSFFPEIFGLRKSCCCAEKDRINDALIKYKQLLSKRDCCQNIFLFYKLPSSNVVLVNIQQKINLLFSTINLNEIVNNDTTQIANITSLLYQPPPLGLFGQELLQFIHCLKIPLPEIA